MKESEQKYYKLQKHFKERKKKQKPSIIFKITKERKEKPEEEVIDHTLKTAHKSDAMADTRLVLKMGQELLVDISIEESPNKLNDYSLVSLPQEFPEE